MAENRSTVRRIHAGLVLAEILCISAFIFETYRALGGNILSWAYVVEWPILGGYAIFMWQRLLKEERGQVTRPTPDVDDNDPELAAWNEYLASLHRPVDGE